jgi:TolA-binding protein
MGSWERFLKEYPSHEKAPQALVKIARAHESLNQLEQARAAREQLKVSYPGYGASAPAE